METKDVEDDDVDPVIADTSELLIPVVLLTLLLGVLTTVYP